MLEAVGDDDLRAIVAKLVELAKGGDLAAIREVLNRAVGRPAEPPDPDNLDVTETELARRRSVARRALGQAERAERLDRLPLAQQLAELELGL